MKDRNRHLNDEIDLIKALKRKANIYYPFLLDEREAFGNNLNVEFGKIELLTIRQREKEQNFSRKFNTL